MAGLETNISILKQGKGNEENKLYSPKCLTFGPPVRDNILFLHSFSGADTTSAFFRHGKLKFVKLLEKDSYLQNSVSVFKDPSADRTKIAEAGVQFIKKLYGYSITESLGDIRYQCFAKFLNKGSFSLASLPPTETAAKFHSFRTFHQVQKWLGNELQPTEWGWKRTINGLTPITTDKDPALLLSFST